MVAAELLSAAAKGSPQTLPALTLVSGPARSGKSRWAEHLVTRATQDPGTVVYVATGPDLPEDAAWQRRLQLHRARRPAHWQTWEVAGELAAALGRLVPGQVALIDSLGTWVAAHLEREERDWSCHCAALDAALSACPARLVLVCEETGWGVVPATALGGRFRDRLGALQQHLTARCDAAWLVVQGRALDLLALSQPVPSRPCPETPCR